MRVHTATTPLPATTALGRNRKAGFSPLVATYYIETGIRQTGSTMTNSPCNLLLQTQKSRPPRQTVRRTAAVVSSFRPLSPSTPNRCVSRLHPSAHLFFLRKKIPASQKARVGTSTVSLARGANREVKERVKGKASRVQSVCVCVCVYLLNCT